jgi:hypothetical protein
MFGSCLAHVSCSGHASLTSHVRVMPRSRPMFGSHARSRPMFGSHDRSRPMFGSHDRSRPISGHMLAHVPCSLTTHVRVMPRSRPMFGSHVHSRTMFGSHVRSRTLFSRCDLSSRGSVDVTTKLWSRASSKRIIRPNRGCGRCFYVTHSL